MRRTVGYCEMFVCRALAGAFAQEIVMKNPSAFPKAVLARNFLLQRREGFEKGSSASLSNY